MVRKISLEIIITEELECHDNCNDGPCCLNGGKCTENRSGNICICPPRFMGQYCEIGKLIALKYINMSSVKILFYVLTIVYKTKCFTSQIILNSTRTILLSLVDLLIE